MTNPNPGMGNQYDVTALEHSGDTQAIIDALPTQIAFKDHADRFLLINKVLCEVLGKSRQELLGGGMWADLFPREQARELREWDLRVMESGKPAGVIHKLDMNGDRRWVRIDRAPHYDGKGNIIGTVGSAIDVTSMMKSGQASLSQLTSIIPICSVCKKIRDEAGQWHQLENYINARTGTQFTHGYCPECATKVERSMHPRSLVCDKCGSNLELLRYFHGGKRFRRYYCRECGYSQEFFREVLEE